MLPKMTIITFSLLLSSAAFAQSSVIQQRLLSTSQRVADRIYRDINYIDAERARAVTQKLEEAEALLAGGAGGGRPAPYPDPRPPGQYQQLVSGRVGSQTFSFQASSLSDVFRRCSTTFASVQNIDQVEVSLDYGAQRSARNSASWWKGPGAVCVQVVKLASELGMRDDGGTAYAGDIAGRAFYFSGYSISEMGPQCEAFVRQLGSVSVDVLSVTNFRVHRVLTNSASYWRSGYEICQQIFSVR